MNGNLLQTLIPLPKTHKSTNAIALSRAFNNKFWDGQRSLDSSQPGHVKLGKRCLNACTLGEGGVQNVKVQMLKVRKLKAQYTGMQLI
eukprot:1155681-Pelagomonas_calceolata.AAC.3